MTIRSGRRWPKIAAGFAVALLVVWLFRGAILTAIGSYLVDAGPPHKADVVLVLAGDATGERIKTGANLVREGFAPKVLVSGPSGAYGEYECEPAIRFAVKAGYPESYFVHAENDARSTDEEAQQMRKYFEQAGARSVLLVTSDFHTRRAARIFRKAYPQIQFYVVAAPTLDFQADRWWKSRQGEKVAFLEWTKTLANWWGI